MKFKADLHVHSKYSNHPSEWFLQRLGASESYTEVDYIYQTAKQRGMHLVTITDHNAITGSLLLTEKYPHDTFTGVEATAYFPEDHCKVHILIYDFTEQEFNEIQELRNNIYELRDFIKEHKLAYSVAHATYSVNNTINVEHLEKLVLLFDNFEGYNGARNKRSNQSWIDALKALTPQDIERLYQKHGIEPFSNDPWIKNFTGGSDDHAGLFIARTYTVIDTQSKADFLDALKNKNSHAEGRHNDYQSLALSFYKITYDFIKNKTNKLNSSFLNLLNSFIFDNPKPGLKEFLIMQKLKSKNGSGLEIKKIIGELLDELKEKDADQIDTKFSIVYQKAARITDEIIKGVLDSLTDVISQGELFSLLNNFSMLFTGIFLCAPFITTMSHMHQSRDLVPEFMKGLKKTEKQHSRRILWFTDTLDDLNNLEILRNICGITQVEQQEIKVVTALLPAEATGIPPFVLNLSHIFTMPIPYSENHTLRIPSILGSLEAIHMYDPDMIYISTPGPIGLLGRLAARLLHIPEVGIYHTDFPELAGQIIKDISSTAMLKSYEKWFYGSMTTIYASTSAHLNVLRSREFEEHKLKLLPRGVDPSFFTPLPDCKSIFHEKNEIPEGINLLYYRPVTSDKNIDLLIDIFKELAARYQDLNLIIIGDSLGNEILKFEITPHSRIFWLGQIDACERPVIYAAADLLLFPSTTEPFGQAILEAQYCGLPVLVARDSRCKEMVADHETGLIVPSQTATDWIKKIDECLTLLSNQPKQFMKMRAAARERVTSLHPFEQPLDEVSCPAEKEKQKLEWANSPLFNELPVLV